MLTHARLYKRTATALSALGIALVGSLAGLETVSMAYAAPAPVKVSREVGEPLQAAMELAQKGDYTTALTKLTAADSAAKTDGERYQISTVRRFIFAKTKNYAKLAPVLETQLTTGLMPAAEAKTVRKELAQIYDRINDTPKAVNAAKTYINTYGHDADLSIYIAAKALEAKDYKGAAEWAGKSIKGETAANRKPPESWYRIQMKAEYEGGNLDGYYNALEAATVHYPSDQFWRALIGRARTQADYVATRYEIDENRLLLASGIALTADEKLNMAEAAFERELSPEAYGILEQMSKNGELEADASKAARNVRLFNKAKSETDADKASLQSIISEATQKGDGQAIANVAELSLALGDAKGAAELYKQALSKPGLDASLTNATKLRLGIAQYRSGDAAAARKTWSEIKGTDGAAELARVWTLISNKG